MTYKQRLNQQYGLEKNTEHSLKELQDLSGIPLFVLKEVEKRGYGAYNTSLSSVRLKDFSKNPDLREKGKNKRLSPEQWALARVYAFIFKSLFQGMKYKKQDTDLYKFLLSNGEISFF